MQTPKRQSDLHLGGTALICFDIETDGLESDKVGMTVEHAIVYVTEKSSLEWCLEISKACHLQTGDTPGTVGLHVIAKQSLVINMLAISKLTVKFVHVQCSLSR